MANLDIKKISFLELAKKVLMEVGNPMSAKEIWNYAQQNNISNMLQTTGKTPEATLGAQLYTNVLKSSSEFVKTGLRPSLFHLKTMTPTLSDITPPPVVPQKKYYSERELHPLLVWFAETNFGTHSRTIYHEKSLKKGTKQNEWIHPDMVGFSLTTKDWTHEVVQLAQNSGAMTARLYSFEIKTRLDFPSLREFFFQAVSNSSWAQQGYLVAVEIDEDPDFRAELTRLSQSFGIGVIQLVVDEPVDSNVLLAAQEKSEIDWKTADRIAAVNSDFQEFISDVAKSVKINQPALNGFDKLLTEVELSVHLKKILGKL